MLEKNKIKKIIESLLFSSSCPIKVKEIKNFFSEEKVSSNLIQEIICEFDFDYSKS